MASRYASAQVIDYCYSPLKVLKDGKYIFVPCGKCNGCLLHKSNTWSQRLSYEIDNNPFSIFFTLTYDNYFLPTLVPFLDPGIGVIFVSDHRLNRRWDGSKVVLRQDVIIIRGKEEDFVPIQNDSRISTVNYFSKRDVVLWFKLLRKDILNVLGYGKDSFRYYVISEIGPTTSRCHAHGILFPKSKEVAEFLLEEAMYKNWKMCDYSLFRQYTRYCNSGTANYVSNYVTNFDQLPSIYKNSSIKPFRLSSKAPAIGYSAFDPKEVFENVSQRVITYTRSISSIDQTYILGYPKAYMLTVFPKCYRFSELSYRRLLWIYGYLYREVRGFQKPYSYISKRLRADLHASDFQATTKCYKFCLLIGCTPFHYLWLLDRYYYLTAMDSLSRWYTWQESNFSSPVLLLSSYNNLSDYVSNKSSLSSYQLNVIRSFCEQFLVDFDSLTKDDLIEIFKCNSEKLKYISQVDDICDNLVKMPKVNEFTGNSPHFI